MLNVAGTCKPVAIRYTGIAPETTGNRGESRNYRRRISAARRFFFVRTSSIAFNGRALVGVRLRTPVAFCAGLSTLLRARPPRLRADVGFINLSIESAYAPYVCSFRAIPAAR